MKNPYEILQLEKNASQEEIKKQYRKLAFEKHPDRNDGNDEEFKEISAAYEILSDPAKKQNYDTYGNIENQNFNPGFGFQGGFTHINVDDLFGDMFGFNKNKKSVKGQDLHHNISISFMESVKGTTKNISIEHPIECGFCIGSGAKDNKDKTTCLTCNGNGKISSFSGVVNIIRPCNGCGGKGFVIMIKCDHCSGSGNKIKTSNYNVSIPAGVESGTSMRLSGKGLSNEYNVAPGDLYVHINVARDTKFEKSGSNIISDLKLDYLDAILGCKINIETIHGNTVVNVPQFLQNDTILKISGQGIHTQDGKKGDHMVRVKISIPNKISENEKNKLEEIKNGRK